MVRIISVEQDGNDGVLVHFSDGSIAGYVVEELLELRPAREGDPQIRLRPGETREERKM